MAAEAQPSCRRRQYRSAQQRQRLRAVSDRIGALGKFRNHKTFLRAGFYRPWNRSRRRTFSSRLHSEEEMMGRGILLWMLGVPIPVILLLWLFFGR
jgi:hypothetical protein